MSQLLELMFKPMTSIKRIMCHISNTRSAPLSTPMLKLIVKETGKSHPIQPPPKAKKLTNDMPPGNRNRNNIDTDAGGTAGGANQRKLDLPLAVLVRLIVISLQQISHPKGSSLKDIRRFLATAGIIEESTDMRQAMIVALKLGAVARPVWAVKAGLYGRYVVGDGIPIFAGRKSRPKNARHRSAQWVSATTSKRSSRKKPGRRNRNRRSSTSRLRRVNAT